MDTLAARLDRAIKAGGVAITGVSLPDHENKATWTVRPATLQGAAQPIIDAFLIDDPQAVTASLDAETDTALDAIVADFATALFENLAAINAEATAGTLKGNVSVWKQRIRARVKALRRAKGG